MTIIHTCICGRSYTADQWQKLPLVGYQAAEDPDEILQLRTCACESTRAFRVPGPGFWLALAMGHVAHARVEAQCELLALSQAYIDKAATCMRQATELMAMLGEQRRQKSEHEAVALFEAAVQYEPRAAFG